MQVQPDDFQVLRTVAQYYVLTREQIQRICFPAQASGRSTRKRLLRLRNAGFIAKHSVPVALPTSNSAAPVYYPTIAGAQALASFFDDDVGSLPTPDHQEPTVWPIGLPSTQRDWSSSRRSQRKLLFD